MVKTPRTRHSRTEKDPVTIDLQPGEVSRVKAEAEAKEPVSATEQEPIERPAADDLQGAESTRTQEITGGAAADAAADEPDAEPATATVDQPAEEPTETYTSYAASDAAESARTADGTSAPASESSTGFGRTEAAAVPPPVGNRRGATLAAGVAGGVIALLLAAGLQASGLLPGAADRSGDAAAIAELETRIAELGQRIEALGAGSSQALETRVAQSEERVAELEASLQAIRDEVDTLAARPGGGDVASLEGRIAEIETAIAAFGGSTAPEAALASVEEQIATLRQDLSALRDAGTQSAARLDSLEQALNDLSARVEENAAAPATAVVIAASALKAAIDRGMPFTTELDTYASLAPDAPEVAELRQFAETGVPTLSQLVSESDAAADAMIAAARPVDPQAGFFDRLWGSAKGLVQVRPVGAVEGEGVPETVARLDAAIEAGDLERALAEYETLPEVAKAAGAEFMAKVRARHTADTLVDQALASALRA